MARPIAEEFGRAFRDAYQAAGLTQTELADRLQQRGWVKVDQSQISKWVRGVSVPPLDVLPAVDDACDMPRGYVLEIAGYVDAAALVDKRELQSDPFARLKGRQPASAGQKAPRAG